METERKKNLLSFALSLISRSLALRNVFEGHEGPRCGASPAASIQLSRGIWRQAIKGGLLSAPGISKTSALEPVGEEGTPRFLRERVEAEVEFFFSSFSPRSRWFRFLSLSLFPYTFPCSPS